MTKGIYSLTNTQNGKRYIGSSVNVERRFRMHFTELRKGTHWNPHLQAAWLQYGPEVFEPQIVEVTDELEVRETYWIEYFKTLNRDNGYNIALPDRTLISDETKVRMSEGQKARYSNGGRPGFLGKQHTPAAKEMISLAIKGTKREVSQTTRDKLAMVRKGKSYEDIYGSKAAAMRLKQSVNGRLRCGEKSPMWGRKANETTRRRMSASRLGKCFLSEAGRRRLSESKTVDISDEQKNIIKTLFAQFGRNCKQIQTAVGLSRYKVQQVIEGLCQSNR